jgi:hypothetical protein
MLVLVGRVTEAADLDIENARLPFAGRCSMDADS